MRHLIHILIKTLMIGLILYITFGWTANYSLNDIVTVTLVLVLASYLIGDQFILPAFGNPAATIADFGLAFVTLWLMSYNLGLDLIWQNISLFAVAALFITLGEWFFHRYLEKSVLRERER